MRRFARASVVAVLGVLGGCSSGPTEPGAMATPTPPPPTPTPTPVQFALPFEGSYELVLSVAPACREQFPDALRVRYFTLQVTALFTGAVPLEARVSAPNIVCA